MFPGEVLGHCFHNLEGDERGNKELDNQNNVTFALTMRCVVVCCFFFKGANPTNLIALEFCARALTSKENQLFIFPAAFWLSRHLVSPVWRRAAPPSSRSPKQAGKEVHTFHCPVVVLTWFPGRLWHLQSVSQAGKTGSE